MGVKVYVVNQTKHDNAIIVQYKVGEVCLKIQEKSFLAKSAAKVQTTECMDVCMAHKESTGFFYCHVWRYKLPLFSLSNEYENRMYEMWKSCLKSDRNTDTYYFTTAKYIPANAQS